MLKKGTRKRIYRSVASLSVLMLLFLDFENLLCLHTSWEEEALRSNPLEANGESISSHDHINFLSFTQLLETKLDLNNLPPVYSNDLHELKDDVVTVLGFMEPLDQIKNVTHFMLKRNKESCQFCDDNPALLNLIYVKLGHGDQASYSDKLLKVSGKLKLLEGSTPIEERGGEDKTMAVFSLVDSSLKVATEDDKRNYLEKVYHNKIKK